MINNSTIGITNLTKSNQVSSQKQEKPVLNPQPHSDKTNFLTNQLLSLAMLGATLVGSGTLSSCTEDYFLEDDPITNITINETNNKAEQTLTTSIEDLCTNLNIETGINKYGNNASCNKISYPDGSYDEVYSQWHTSEHSPDTIYTKGIIIHRNLPSESPYKNCDGSGVQYLQRITKNDEGILQIVRRYDGNDALYNVKKGDIELITIQKQNDNTYIYSKMSPDGKSTTETIYHDGENTFLGNSIIEPYSEATDGKMPQVIAFNPTVDDWEDVINF